MKLAENLNRLGTETAFSVLAEAKKLEAQGKEMIHLGLGQPDFMTPKHIMDAAKKAIDDGHHGYVLANGILECRQAVSRKIKSLYKKDVSPDRDHDHARGKTDNVFCDCNDWRAWLGDNSSNTWISNLRVNDKLHWC